MGLLSGVLSAAIGFMLARLVTRILVGLGVGYVAYEGFSTLIDTINGYLGSSLGALPPQVFQIIQILNVEQAINLILSSYMARLTIVPVYRRFVTIPPAAGVTP